MNKDKEYQGSTMKYGRLGAAVLGALSLVGCRGTLSMSDINASHIPQLDTAAAQYAPISRGLEDHVEAAVPPELPAPVYDNIGIGRDVLGPEAYDTASRVADAIAYMKGFQDSNLAAHIVFEGLQKVSNDDISELFPSYNPETAARGRDYSDGIRRALMNGHSRERIEELRQSIEGIADSDTKAYFQTIMSDFDQRAAAMRKGSHFIIAVERMFGQYGNGEGVFFDLYHAATMATMGCNPRTLGDQVLRDNNIAVDLSDVDTAYGLRDETHAARGQLDDLRAAGTVTDEEIEAGLFALTSEERSRRSQVNNGGFNVLSLIPVVGIVTGAASDFGQAGGYDGVVADNAEDFVKIVQADYSGLTKAPVNMDANEKLASGLVSILSTAAPLAIPGGGASGSAGGASSITGSRTGRTGGARIR